MHKYLFLLLILFSAPVLACDFDGDLIDDILTYDSSTFTWRVKLSTDHSTFEYSNFGSEGALPVPGNYVSGENTLFAYIPTNYFWTFSNGETIFNQLPAYGRVDASYLGGHDFNGDRITDAAKMINRCGVLKANCHRSRNTRFNVLYNLNQDGQPFAGDSAIIPVNAGRGLSPLFSIDANNDGRDDVCYGVPKRKNKKIFRGICKDVMTSTVVQKFNIGKIFNLPLSAKVNGKNLLVSWKTRRKKADTKIWLVSPEAGVETQQFIIPSDGTIVIGDWLGTGSDQIAAATGGIFTVLNPLDSNISQMLMPAGSPLDCNNNVYGIASETYLKTRNVCRILGCS